MGHGFTFYLNYYYRRLNKNIYFCDLCVSFKCIYSYPVCTYHTYNYVDRVLIILKCIVNALFGGNEFIKHMKWLLKTCEFVCV